MSTPVVPQEVNLELVKCNFAGQPISSEKLDEDGKFSTYIFSTNRLQLDGLFWRVSASFSEAISNLTLRVLCTVAYFHKDYPRKTNYQRTEYGFDIV